MHLRRYTTKVANPRYGAGLKGVSFFEKSLDIPCWLTFINPFSPKGNNVPAWGQGAKYLAPASVFTPIPERKRMASWARKKLTTSAVLPSGFMTLLIEGMEGMETTVHTGKKLSIMYLPWKMTGRSKATATAMERETRRTRHANPLFFKNKSIENA